MPSLSSPPTAPAVLAHPSPPPFEVADVARAYGAAFRTTHHISHEQARVLRAIAQCRTAALGGHVEHCLSCGMERVCYDSCRNRHCPKCQGSARAKWLAAEQALLLPIPTSTSSSLCPINSIPCFASTNAPSTTYCSRLRPRPCRSLLAICSILGLNSVLRQFSIPGARP